MTFPFRTCLNVSTLFPYKLDVIQQIEVAAQAGYEGIELWMRDIDTYLAAGGSLPALKRRLADAGLEFPNVIAFFEWAASDEEERQRGLARAESEIRIAAELGCAGIAAPPFGRVEEATLLEMAQRINPLYELAAAEGVDVILEFWGHAAKLSRLSEAMYVAAESGIDAIRLLVDPFHMYKGGSPLTALAYVPGERIGIVHANDIPGAATPAAVTDRDRVFPGEGVYPSARFAEILYRSGYRGFLSLELFIEDFGDCSALEVARSGLESMHRTYSIVEPPSNPV